MPIRPRTLWRVPVFCTAASFVCTLLTIFVSPLFCLTSSVGADGTSQLVADPLRTLIFHSVLFLAVLLLGGRWAFRSMTRAEIAVSAAILSALYLALSLAQLSIPEFPLTMGILSFQQWITTVSSLLLKVQDSSAVAMLLADLTPFLFVPFGRKAS